MGPTSCLRDTFDAAVAHAIGAAAIGIRAIAVVAARRAACPRPATRYNEEQQQRANAKAS